MIYILNLLCKLYRMTSCIVNRNRGNSDPFDIKLTDEDIDPGYKTETAKDEIKADHIDWKTVAIFYPLKGGRMWN